MRILLTNDDGIGSAALRELRDRLRRDGHEVVVSAPAEACPGAAATFDYFRPHCVRRDAHDADSWSIDGSPAVASTCTWRQTFNDSFDGTTLNTSLWDTTYGSGNNGEQQRYVPDAFELGNGVLKIKAEKRNTDGYPYTSGIITTQDRFSQRYGYFKMRAKLIYNIL